jgi:hypothetical protein
MIDVISECILCGSSRLLRLNAEIALHFLGFEGLNKEPMFVSPKVLLCSDCGFILCNLSERDLQRVKERTAEDIS